MTGPAIPGLTGDEKLLAVTDAHLPYCDKPSIDDCPECRQRLQIMRRYLTVLDAAGRLRTRPEEREA